MSEVVIAVLQNGAWQFYNEKIEPINPKRLDGKKIYAILPDNLFYFFQTEITARKRITETVRAYAKNCFPLEETDFVGYVKTKPILGYIFKREINGQELIKKASLITTPLLIQFVLKHSPFIYAANGIVAIVNNGLLRYLPGDEDTARELLKGIDSPYTLITPDIKDTIKGLIKAQKAKKTKLLHLNVMDTPSISVTKSITLGISMLILIIFCLTGGILRYKVATSRLKNLSQRIEAIYEQAFKGKSYPDPYGMLLYKARSCSLQKGIPPLRLLYILSQAQNGRLNIDLISYKEGKYELKGQTEDYDRLVKYVNALKRLKVKAKILNTTSKGGKLKFSIMCR